MAGNRPQPAQQRAAITDSAPRPAAVYEFDVPEADGLHKETTQDFGSIRTIGLQLLTPLQEKYAAQAAKGDPIGLAYELARRALVEVTNERGEVFQLREEDGSRAMCWAQLHPKIRTLALSANANISTPNETTNEAFLASRRIRA